MEKQFELIEKTEEEIIFNILNRKGWNQEDTNRLTIITDEVAKQLAKYNSGFIYLNGLKELSVTQAEYLADTKTNQSDLLLNGLNYIDDLTAMTLSEAEEISFLLLNGLTELTDIAAKSFSKVKGSQLELKGVISMSDTAAKYLAKREHPAYLNKEMEARVNSFRSKDNI